MHAQLAKNRIILTVRTPMSWEMAEVPGFPSTKFGRTRESKNDPMKVIVASAKTRMNF